MAPRGKRTDAAEPQAFHELGVRGRKTGVFLPDRGERDEHGMQPLESIFSSPRKATASTNGDEESGSEDMDIASSPGPGPRTLLKNQRNMQYPIPRSRSPRKTNFNSPARKNPHLDRGSSPPRSSNPEDRDPTVTRRLDFASLGDNSRSGRGRGKINGVSRPAHADIEEVEDEDEDEELEDLTHGAPDSDVMDMLEQSLQMVEGMERSALEDSDDEPVLSKPVSAKKGRGRPAGKQAQARTAPEEVLSSPRTDASEPIEDVEEEEEEAEQVPSVKKSRGRPKKKNQEQNEELQSKSGAKKRRSLINSTGDDDEETGEAQEHEDGLRQAKRQRTKGPVASKPVPAKSLSKKTTNTTSATASSSQSNKTKTKGKGKQPQKAQEQNSEDAEEAGDTSLMALQRGPPLPKARGLVSVHRDADMLKQTRSGRHSYRPLDYWRGEQVVREEEERDDMFYDGGFVVPAIKEIVRVPDDAPPSKRAPRSKGRAKAKAAAIPEEEELEEWETNPGTITGEIVLWEPEHEQHPPADDEPVQVMDERIAISADAVQTTDIRDATFRFAKTLAMPFMGAGIVDLPPGAEKRPKNSRKMHMVFFVHYGKVMVTINEAQFRITAGGTWFVPRGNYYSITNDYDTPCRVFFAQACEVSSPQDGDAADQSTMALS